MHALQRLPHIILLNTDWYHERLKPIMAEWLYLWLQKQHLHGIHRHEAVTYMLEGAVARSEATAKVSAIDAAIAKVESQLGERPPISPPMPTRAHIAAMGCDLCALLTICMRSFYMCVYVFVDCFA